MPPLVSRDMVLPLVYSTDFYRSHSMTLEILRTVTRGTDNTGRNAQDQALRQRG